ncbi:phosphotransferase [Konateibacter massiliensis]|uniref:phosphotransferase n=1 Tax=Konateibacter massiliensis TaxID=2002841 RepID=UPI000C14FC3F|nr:phosphotransferase [Konateibacter massiliensis]
MTLEHVVAKRSNKTVYQSGDTVVKVFDENFPKSDILNEALNQSRIEETGLNIPKVLEVSKIDGKWAITMEYIKGKTLAELIKENPANVDTYLEQFVDLQLEIHTKKSPLLNKQKEKFARKIQNSKQIDASTKYELLSRLDGMPKHTKVCHGDFNPSNIIVSDKGNFVIDWSHATQGNASADAARSYLLFTLQDAELAKKYMKLFCQKSDTAIQYVQQWLPIVAATQLEKGNPDEKEMLTQWLNVVEYQG